MMNKTQQQFRRGGVSMFLVVVSCIFVSLMVASFMKIMIRDNQNASSQDLSQSAYDSAQAGIEDAKRLLSRYNSLCSSGVVSTECDRMANAINSESCSTLSDSNLVSLTDGEVKVRTNTGGSANNDDRLNQAYTCVKIRRNTADFIGGTGVGESKMIPLNATNSFNRVRISWHSRKNLTNQANTAINLLEIPRVGNNYSLPNASSWNNNTNRPALLKAQFIGASSNDLSQLDTPFFGDANGLNEQLYYPVRNTGRTSTTLPANRRTGDASSTSDFTPVTCLQNLNSGTYACQVTVNIGNIPAGLDKTYLRLTPIYTDTDFSVELLNNNTVVEFNGVQPKVDSTGRANDKFRRVESRLEYEGSNISVPQFALQSEGDSGVCKNFSVSHLNNKGVTTNCQIP